MQKIKTLHQLVGKLRKRHPCSCLRRKPLFNGVFRHHVVHSNVFSYVADEIKEGKILHPVVVVDKFSRIRLVRIKIKEFCQLIFYTLLVMSQCGLIEQVSLRRFHGRISNHSCSSANQGNGFMPRTLEMLKHHHAHQVPDVQRIGGWVNANISSSQFRGQLFFCSGHYIVDHAPPF